MKEIVSEVLLIPDSVDFDGTYDSSRFVKKAYMVIENGEHHYEVSDFNGFIRLGSNGWDNHGPALHFGSVEEALLAARTSGQMTA